MLIIGLNIFKQAFEDMKTTLNQTETEKLKTKMRNLKS